MSLFNKYTPKCIYIYTTVAIPKIHISYILHLQLLKDTSQYVISELAALEDQQREIDARAAVVEKDLRTLMETGILLHISTFIILILHSHILSGNPVIHT